MGEFPHEHSLEGAGNEATSELTRGGEFSERPLDAEVDNPELKKDRREQWPSWDPPPVVHKRDAAYFCIKAQDLKKSQDIPGSAVYFRQVFEAYARSHIEQWALTGPPKKAWWATGSVRNEWLLATDLVILNHGQMTWTTPELAPFSPNYHTTPTGGRLSSRQI
ncbi:hypothetical protein TNCV_1367301 [Trichonephila clavipes]|nr:hypothetical protein TNCV_1367301 [Trichonephila clavipes]